MIRLKVRRITRAVVIPSTLHIWPNHYQKGVYIWKKLMNEKEPGTISRLIIQKQYQIKNLNSSKPSTREEKLKMIFCCPNPTTPRTKMPMKSWRPTDLAPPGSFTQLRPSSEHRRWPCLKVWKTHRFRKKSLDLAFDPLTGECLA